MIIALLCIIGSVCFKLILSVIFPTLLSKCELYNLVNFCFKSQIENGSSSSLSSTLCYFFIFLLVKYLWLCHGVYVVVALTARSITVHDKFLHLFVAEKNWPCLLQGAANYKFRHGLIYPTTYMYLEYSYSKYCNLIGQLQGAIFCSALVQGTILIVPGHHFDSACALRRQHTYCAVQLIIIRSYMYTQLLHVCHHTVIHDPSTLRISVRIRIGLLKDAGSREYCSVCCATCCCSVLKLVAACSGKLVSLFSSSSSLWHHCQSSGHKKDLKRSSLLAMVFAYKLSTSM